MKCVAVLSGGMDSTVAMAYVMSGGHQVLSALNFHYGSKHNDREQIAVKAISEHYRVPLMQVPLDFVANHFKSDLLKTGGDVPQGHYGDPSMKRTVVSFRNGIMLSLAAGFAESIGAKGILLGNHFGDHAIYPDCREIFVNAMRQAVELGTYEKIQLMSPFVKKTKTDVAKLGQELKVPFALTYSCYEGRENHCGKCGTCFERKEAFRDSKVTDPTIYEA